MTLATQELDHRAWIIKRLAEQVFEVTGTNPLLDIAMALERIALKDEYFVTRKLYPNVDFYSGIILKALGIPETSFTVLFAMGRMPGWIAQWLELGREGQAIGRPRQIYVGANERDYTPLDKRG